MKKGPLHFLGRKNNSLFDTNVKMKDMDNVELVLGSSAIPESGTASVRARPTVKHHTSSYDSFQGFAVPTPKVPLLPPVNGPKINGSGEHPPPSNMYSVGGDHLTNGSVPDLTEDIFVPPHPSMAPPLPPGTFLPPPDFMGDLNTLDQSTLQPPSMPAPKPPSLAPSLQEEDFTFLKPPPMAPPKPPSTSSSSSMSSIPISNPPSSIVPDHPRFAPPQPPTERQPKTKMPPPKPIRLSSMSNLDSPPQTPAPPPPVQTPTLSTFNPQNTAKLYHIPTTSILKGYEEPDTRPKQKLLLEDSLSIKTSPLLDGADDKVPKVATPSNPVLKDAQELKDNLQTTPTPQKSLPGPNKEPTTTRVSTPPIEKPLRYSHQTSPSPPKVNGTSVNSEPIMDKPEMSPSPSHKFSPLLDRKLRNLKSNETHGAKEGAAASPLALLMAAKKREKQRTTHSLSRENSAKKDEQPSSNIPPSDSSPNSFVITPRSSSSSSLASQEKVPESPKPAGPGNHTQTVQIPEKLSNSPVFKSQTPSSSPNLSQIYGSPSLTNLVAPTQNKVKSPSKPQASIDEVDKVDINLPVLPPPPEFDDLDDIIGPPPAITPPDPPRKTAPAPAFNPPPPPPPAPTLTPAPPPKPKPPQAPKLPPPDTAVKPKLQAQTKPKVGPNHIPSNLSPSQVTLLSILQKKMAEMDHKMNPMKETEANSDDWGNPLSDEENKVPIVPKVTPPSKNNIVVNKTAGLDIRELEGKVVRKHQDTSSVRSPTSNGVQSKHQYGMTFTVRPGTKNPITPWSSAES